MAKTPHRLPSRRKIVRKIAMAALLLAVAIAGSAQPAAAGAYQIEPGATLRVDTGERQSYTTITITNPEASPGRLSFDAPVGQTVDVPANGRIELYGQYGRPSVSVTNTGPVRLRVLTRYMEVPRLP